MRRESTSGTETESAYYWYDAANALTERTVYPGPVNTYYYYDLNGALTEMMEAGDTTYFEYGDNQLISKITPPVADGQPWEFWYDARLNRYAMDKGGTVSYYNWGGLNQVEERDATGALTARYSQGYARNYAIGSVTEVERVAGGATYFQYPLMDLRGTAYAVADANEATQISYSLDAFGRELASAGGNDPNVPNEMVYQTNWLTVQLGSRLLCLSMNRVYDLDTGRFLSRDFLPTLNKYDPWSGNPVGSVDPSGLVRVKTEEKKWTVIRDSTKKRAEAIAELGAKVKDLAKISKLNPVESKLWLEKPQGQDYVVKGPDDCNYEIPNTILMVWLGEAGRTGRAFVGLGQEQKDFESEGYHVAHWQIGAEDKRILDEERPFLPSIRQSGSQLQGKHFKSDLLRLVRLLSTGKALTGWFSWSHGSESGIQGPWGEAPWPFNKPKQCYKDIDMTYEEIGENLSYGLSLALVHACFSSAPRSDAKSNLLKGNPYGRFWGHTGEFVPGWTGRSGLSYGGSYSDIQMRLPSGGNLPPNDPYKK